MIPTRKYETGDICTYDAKGPALFAALGHETRSGTPHYVVRGVCCWIVTTTMPLLGEWYTADGLQHGGGAR